MLRPRLGLANFVDAVNRAAAIANKHFTVAVECEAGRNAQVAGESDDFAFRGHTIHAAIEAAGDKHAAGAIKSDAGRIHYVAGKVFDGSITIDAIDRYGNVLTTRTRSRHEQRTIARIERRVRDRMKIAGQFSSDR